MSIEAIAWAYRQELPARDKSVLLALCYYYNRKEKSAWPKQATLAKLTGLNRTTIYKALSALENEHKLIASEPRHYPDGRYASKVYWIKFRPESLDEPALHDDQSITVHDDQSITVHDDQSINKNSELRSVN